MESLSKFNLTEELLEVFQRGQVNVGYGGVCHARDSEAKKDLDCEEDTLKRIRVKVSASWKYSLTQAHLHLRTFLNEKNAYPNGDKNKKTEICWKILVFALILCSFVLFFISFFL